MTAAEVRTRRLVLEPVRRSHAPEIWPQLDDERMWRYFPALRPATLTDLQRLYEKWERGSQNADEVWLNWLCRERSDGVLVGAMQSTIVVSERFAYLAYAVYPVHQRKGYAREAAHAVIAYVRQRYGIQRFLAQMDTRNEPSFRLAEALGFRRTEVSGGEYSYELLL